MRQAIIILIVLFILLYLLKKRQVNEGFTDKRLVQAFKIKIGVFHDKDYTSYYNYVYKMSRFIPIEIVKYSNRFQVFYELKRRNVDFIFTNEKDYYVYWNNQRKKKKSFMDSLKRDPDIQAISMAFYQYIFIIADYKKIISKNDINGRVVAIMGKNSLGRDFEIELFEKFKTHLIYRYDDLEKDFNNLCNGVDIMVTINEHPNKQLQLHSNKKEIYLLDIDGFETSKDYYDKYLFLTKKKIDLKYYPEIYQRYNSINRLGSLLIDTSPYMNAFATKTMLMGLQTVGNEYVYEFMKVYYNNIFNAIKKTEYFNNFNEIDMSASRLAGPNAILNFHEGARKFYRKIGNYTFNPDERCGLISFECTNDQLASFGDYLQ
jgi:TRAP-type uncharacterized transport system substrate-binding protein